MRVPQGSSFRFGLVLLQCMFVPVEPAADGGT
jgi:hypothetical protein